jgi:hypothetical protein
MDIDMGMDMVIGMDTDTDIFEGKICLIEYQTAPKLGSSNIGIDLNLDIVTVTIQETDLMPKRFSPIYRIKRSNVGCPISRK